MLKRWLLGLVALALLPRSAWSQGMPVGPEFRVNAFTTGLQGYSSVAAGSAGNFVVVWQSYGQDGSSYGIYSQRYGQIVPVELMRFGVE
jgi:hypothetical protein